MYLLANLLVNATAQSATPPDRRGYRVTPRHWSRTGTPVWLLATTIHAAQGVSADTMHGLGTGHESRQQLYAMLIRGRAANHLYLQVVGDGDPHSIIRPDTISPHTPTETLQQILVH